MGVILFLSVPSEKGLVTIYFQESKPISSKTSSKDDKSKIELQHRNQITQNPQTRQTHFDRRKYQSTRG